MKQQRLEPAKIVEVHRYRGGEESVAIGDRTGRIYRTTTQNMSLNQRVIVFAFNHNFIFKSDDQKEGW